MSISLGASCICKGFGKRCEVEVITGLVGFGADLKKKPKNWWNLLPDGEKLRFSRVWERIKKGNGIDVFGGLGYLRGVWEKVWNGSNCGFGWFRNGLKRRPVIGGIFWRWKLLYM